VSHHESARDEDRPQLLRFAATNLPEYIFDTENLSVIRAASDQLDQFVDGLSGVAGDTEVVYAAASEALLTAPSEAAAESAVAAVRKALLEGTASLPYATAVVGRVPADDGGSLAKAVSKLENRLRRAQLRQATVVPGDLHGKKPCELDGVRPATDVLHVGTDKLAVSAHTFARGRSGQALRSTRALDLCGGMSMDSSIAAWDQSFEALADFAPPGPVAGKMCVVQADGNRFTACRSRLKSVADLGHFSDAVREAQRRALSEALCGLWEHAPEKQSLPFHVLYWAGDEISLVLPAAHGLAACRSLLRSFSSHWRDVAAGHEGGSVRSALEGALKGGALTLAVGMVICDTHQPIRQVADLAGALCESAKSRFAAQADDAYDPEAGNVMDFVVIENGMIPSDLAAHRSRHLARPDGTIAGLRPLDVVQLTDLMDDVRALKTIDFPVGRGHAFVEAILGHDQGDEQAVQDAFAKIYSRVDWDLVDAAAEGHPDIQARMDRLRPRDNKDCAPGSVCVDSWPERRELWDYVSVTEGAD
jgi:hypothetical protein